MQPSSLFGSLLFSELKDSELKTLKLHFEAGSTATEILMVWNTDDRNAGETMCFCLVDPWRRISCAFCRQMKSGKDAKRIQYCHYNFLKAQFGRQNKESVLFHIWFLRKTFFKKQILNKLLYEKLFPSLLLKGHLFTINVPKRCQKREITENRYISSSQFKLK